MQVSIKLLFSVLLLQGACASFLRSGYQQEAAAEVRELQATGAYTEILGMLQDRFDNRCTISTAVKNQIFVECYFGGANAALLADGASVDIQVEHLFYCDGSSSCESVSFVDGDTDGNIKKAAGLLGVGAAGAAETTGEEETEAPVMSEYDQIVKLLNDNFNSSNDGRCNSGYSQISYVTCFRPGLSVQFIARGGASSEPVPHGFIYCGSTSMSSCKNVAFAPGQDSVGIIRNIVA